MSALNPSIWMPHADHAIFSAGIIGFMLATQAGLRRWRRSAVLPYWTWLVAITVLVAALPVINWIDRNERREWRTVRESFALTYAREFEHLGHTLVQLNTPADDPHYLVLIDAQKRWLTVNPTVADIYTFRKRPDGSLVLVVDAETDYDRNGRFEGDREQRTTIGEVYEEALPLIDRAFAGQVISDETPSADRWGEWVSTYVPLRDGRGQVEAVLGVDYPAKDWVEMIAWHRTAVMAWIGVLELVLAISAVLLAILRANVADRERTERQITDQHRQLEEQVRARSEELLEAQRHVMQSEKLASLGQLAAGVAHEINTPIQFVGDNLQAVSDFLNDLMRLGDEYRELMEGIAKGESLPEALRKLRELEVECDLEYIREDAPKAVAQGLEGVQRVAHIVRAMKDFSHVDRGQVGMVDVNRALENTLTVARNEYKYVADVKTDFAELPGIEAYGGELNQVFLNLLVNAAHAIADTGRRGTITISTRTDHDGVEIAISDTGAGIPREIRSKIFDPFFTTKPVGKGTGQGLNIAHQIVVGKHGGAIRFESEVGKGTTFFIRLPMRLPQRAELADEAAPNDAA